MQVFSCKTTIYTGRGSLAKLKDLVQGKLLIVADPYFMESGVAEEIARLSGAEEVSYFGKVKPDPEVSLAAEGAALVRSFQPQCIVALGGGSAMDCAKAMLYFSAVEAKLIAVPTTSGSGSEVTDFAILTHNGVKHPLVDDKLIPQVAILDGDLLQKLPASLIADSGFDVLAHALEALVAKNASAITDALATDGFCGAFTHLLTSFHGNTSVRQCIHDASMMAGISFSQAGLGLCHGASHALGGMFHVPHGRLNAILLPSVVSINATLVAPKYAALSRNAGLGGTVDAMGVRNLKNALIRLRRELKLPATLQEAGVSPALVRQNREKLCDSILQDPCCATNPVPVTRQVVCELLEQVTGHG